MWNELIKIKDSKKQSKHYAEAREKASMYLRQLNTAGGRNIIGDEVQMFLDQNKSIR
jgi:hypothetical protein